MRLHKTEHPFQTRGLTEATGKPGQATQSLPQLQEPWAVCQSWSPLWPGGRPVSPPAPAQWLLPSLVMGVLTMGLPAVLHLGQPLLSNPPPLQVPALGVLRSGRMAHSAPLPSCPPLLVLPQVPSHVPPAQKAGHSPGGYTNSWAPLLPEDSLQSRLSSGSSDLPGDELTPQSSCPVGRLRLRGLLQRGQSMLFFPRAQPGPLLTMRGKHVFASVGISRFGYFGCFTSLFPIFGLFILNVSLSFAAPVPTQISPRLGFRHVHVNEQQARAGQRGHRSRAVAQPRVPLTSGQPGLESRREC